jgi:hypothetical protein
MTTGEVFSHPGAPITALNTSAQVATQALADAAAKPAVAALHQVLKQSPLAPMSESSPGRFQVFRQGNLTWRIDTVSGEACVLLATHAEWRKPQVYQNGCNKTTTDR